MTAADLPAEGRMFIAGAVRDCLADVAGLDPGAANRVAWRVVDDLAPLIAGWLGEAWGAGFMDAAGQDHPAYPRTRRMTNPYRGGER